MSGGFMADTHVTFRTAVDCDSVRVALRGAMASAGMTRYALAQRCGVTMATIYRFMNGTSRRLNLTTIRKIQSVLPFSVGSCPVCGR